MSTGNSYLQRQAWIYRPVADLLFIISPAFLVTALVLLLPGVFQQGQSVPPWGWMLLIVGIDVAHVYSTLWRTYLDPEEYGRYRTQLTLIPVLGWALGALAFLIDPMLFWRLLAYLAVYHFVRQQYGFFSIYARKENRSSWERKLDAAAIYATTLFPLLWWHLHLPRNFFWFVPGDFIPLPGGQVVLIGGAIIYGGLLLAYVAKEIRMGRQFNLPKQLIFLGTALSWMMGIVIFNGDLAFTATNVVAHGIPYMALVWMYGRKKHAQSRPSEGPGRFFKLRFLPIFLGLLLVLAYFEEGLWDGLIWRDHEGFFPWASQLPMVERHQVLAILVPLLALPQITHYVIDGFIWKIRKPDADLNRIDQT